MSCIDASMGMTPTGVSYETETNTYLAAESAAGASFTLTQKNGINRYFQDLKGIANGSYSTANVLSKIKILYPFLTGVYATDRINMITPGTYNYTDTGSPTYSTSTLSVAYNGSSNFSNTGHTPNGSSTLAGSDFTGFGYHRVDTVPDSNATIGEVGGGNSYMVIGGTLAVNRTMLVCQYQADGTGSGVHNINGLWQASWSATNTINSYYNGALMRTQTITYNNTPSRSVYIGAFNFGPTGYGGTPTVDFYIQQTGTWSDAEQLLIYNATKALKAVFGITWS